ncbi:MAG: hypothetical protein AAF639_03195 [Chloroflexota bacterium]
MTDSPTLSRFCDFYIELSPIVALGAEWAGKRRIIPIVGRAWRARQWKISECWAGTVLITHKPVEQIANLIAQVDNLRHWF